MARLDRLGPAAKEVAQVGAVLGRQFSYGLLHAVHPVSDAELEGSLGKLADAELLYVRGLPPESSYLFKHTLVQDAAYGSLLKSRRRALHGRVAQVLAEQFPEVAEAQAELLAHHYEEAGDVELAVAYYRRAGEQAARSAHEEAIQHLRKAITLLGSLSEVSLQLALGTSLIAVRGYAHAETEGAYVRAHALAQHLGTAAQLFTAMQGLSTVYYNRGELDRGIELAEQALRIAQQTGEATHLIPAHGLMVDTLFLQGKFAISLEHCERMIALYDPSLHRGLALGIGDADQGAIARCSAAWNLWPLGHPDRALARAEEATGLARRVAHPFSLAFALFCEALVHWWRGDLESQRELAEQTIALSEAHGFPLWLGGGHALRAAALVLAGDDATVITEISAGLALADATGSQVGAPMFVALLAQAHQAAGRHSDALATAEAALAVSAQTGQHFWDAELHRLRAELLLASGALGEAEGERLLRRASEIAQAQEAKSLELRAAASLGRLLGAQGRRAEARAVLAPVYGWFTEGFDTRDLVEAKALLEELATSPAPTSSR